ncbi:NAD(P)H-binding protein [Spirillospora sp. NPDC029432]|uniref:NAD(P)H-binding protein n=1 Tax=Spirillospora sp. NPDC029432 TaxID=3154599 RepID=UPI003456A2F4
MTVLVTGANGGVGRLVVDGLVRDGQRVRALTRTPGKASFPDGVEVAGGDLTEPDGLAEALRGVERLYLFPVAATARRVVEMAVDAGVKRIVVLSSGAVTGGLDTDFHLPVEQAVEASGLEWTHVRPGEFMLNKVWLWGPSIRAERVVRDPNPDVAWCPVHERDIADVAVAALLGDGHAGAAYDVNGPELLTLRDQATAIGAAIGKEIRFERVTPHEAREIYMKQGGFAAANADFLLGFEDYSGAEADPDAAAEPNLAAYGPFPTAEAVTGRPARTFAEWARDHATDFR